MSATRLEERSPGKQNKLLPKNERLWWFRRAAVRRTRFLPFERIGSGGFVFFLGQCVPWVLAGLLAIGLSLRAESSSGLGQVQSPEDQAGTQDSLERSKAKKPESGSLGASGRSIQDPAPAGPLLPEVVVRAREKTKESLTSPSPEEAEKTLEQIPGGTNFITADEYRKYRPANNFDVLAYQPGVYAVPEWGVTGAGIYTIRGQGLDELDGVTGLLFMQDGLPLISADNFIHDPTLNDFLGAQYVTVERGANAFDWGAATLGGAINMVTYTGYTHPYTTLYASTGSYGFYQGQMATGGVEGPADYFLSLDDTRQYGFRQHSEGYNLRLVSDVGYRPSEDLETRFYFLFMSQNQKRPGTLGLDEVQDHPTLPGPTTAPSPGSGPFNDFPNFAQFNILSDVTFYRLANKTSLKLDEGQLDFGLWWNNYELFHPTIPLLFFTDNDYGLLVRYTTQAPIGNHSNYLNTGMYLQGSTQGETDFDMQVVQVSPTVFLGPIFGLPQASSQRIAASPTFYILDRFYITDDEEWSIVPAFNFNWAYRRAEVASFPSSPPLIPNVVAQTLTYTGYNPKLGLIYQPEPNIQAFTNVSTSYQPPSFMDELLPAAVLLPAGAAMFPLQAQRAITFEIGTRGSYGPLRWDFAFYRAWVNNELLQLFTTNPNFPLVPFALNATPTIHEGTELGLGAVLAQGLFDEVEGRKDRIVYQMALNWSDFHFVNDPVFHHNHLPTVPEIWYQSYLRYEHPSGFYTGPTFTVADGYWADLANTSRQPGYVVWGWQFGYAREKGPSFYLELRNLLDKRYAWAPMAVPDASAIAAASGVPIGEVPIYYPADGRAIYAGVAWNF
jgi:iron complex outermembrane receptor protein